MKKTPEILLEEMKHHDFGTGMWALIDYNWHGQPAKDIAIRLKKSRAKPGWHIGDPCLFCGTAHDDFEVGDCPKNPQQ